MLRPKRPLHSLSLVALSSILCAAPADADTWQGGFMSNSGILWSYRVHSQDGKAKITFQGRRDTSQFEAVCADALLDSDKAFEARCQHKGSDLRFTLKARLDGDSPFMNYIAANGDRATVQLLREATPPANPSSSPPPPITPPNPISTPTTSKNLNFGDCRQAESMSQAYSARSFLNDQTILGIPASQWTEDTLAKALSWARQCNSAALSRGDVVPPQSTVEQRLSNFEEAARKGMTERSASNARTKGINDFLDDTALLPGGVPVTCRALIQINNPSSRLLKGSNAPSNRDIGLDSPLFGKTLRTLTENDIDVLARKAASCTSQARPLDAQGLLSMYTDVHLETLNFRDWRTRLLEEEQQQKHSEMLKDPAKKREMEENGVRVALQGKPLRQPGSRPSHRALFCAGYFSLSRSYDALISAGIALTLDEAEYLALQIKAPGQGLLLLATQVISQFGVERDLLPYFHAGQAAGLAAEPEAVRKRYAECKDAAADMSYQDPKELFSR